jgi:hypothetical protein
VELGKRISHPRESNLTELMSGIHGGQTMTRERSDRGVLVCCGCCLVQPSPSSVGLASLPLIANNNSCRRLPTLSGQFRGEITADASHGNMF